MTLMSDESVSLECDHCGGNAFTSPNGMFADGDGGACAECGFPASVSVDDQDETDVSAWWRTSELDYARCNNQDCDECAHLVLEGAESKLRRQVKEFHQAFGVPVLDRPQVPSEERVRLRLRLVAEEFCELLESCLDCTGLYVVIADEISIYLNRLIADAPVRVMLPESADALGDLDYVIEGTRLEFGIDGGPIADEIQRSNMAKVGGPVLPGGKIGKPADWTPPDILGELRKQGFEG